MIIYRITNLINGRKYIGRTSKTLKQRWLRHCNEAQRTTHPNIVLHNAIRKYGKEVFRAELLARFMDTDELLEGERLFIAAHLLSGEHLYNLTRGGDGSAGLRHTLSARLKQRVSALDRNLRETSSLRRPCVIDSHAYPSIAQAARDLNVARTIAARWAKTGIGRRVARRSDSRGYRENQYPLPTDT